MGLSGILIGVFNGVGVHTPIVTGLEVLFDRSYTWLWIEEWRGWVRGGDLWFRSQGIDAVRLSGGIPYLLTCE